MNSVILNKVDQLDAQLIDEQSKLLLKSLLIQALPSQATARLSNEITLVIDYLFFRFTVASKETPTPGNKLQNIKYKFTSGRQKMALFLLSVFMPYIFNKLQDLVQRKNWAEAKP